MDRFLWKYSFFPKEFKRNYFDYFWRIPSFEKSQKSKRTADSSRIAFECIYIYIYILLELMWFDLEKFDWIRKKKGQLWEISFQEILINIIIIIIINIIIIIIINSIFSWNIKYTIDNIPIQLNRLTKLTQIELETNMEKSKWYVRIRKSNKMKLETFITKIKYKKLWYVTKYRVLL